MGSRIRSIRPEFWSTEEIVECSAPARLFFLGLHTFADDNGVFEFKPRSLKMKILPADPYDPAELLEELAQNGLIVTFEDGDICFGVIKWFTRDQKPQRPTFTYPPPPPELRMQSGFKLSPKCELEPEDRKPKYTSEHPPELAQGLRTDSQSAHSVSQDEHDEFKECSRKSQPQGEERRGEKGERLRDPSRATPPADSPQEGAENKGSEPETKESKTPPPPRKRPDRKQAGRALLAHYASEFERIKGEAPVITGAKDTRILKALLSKGRSLEAAKSLITSFLEDPPDWHREHGLCEPEHIVAAANQVINRQKSSLEKQKATTLGSAYDEAARKGAGS